MNDFHDGASIDPHPILRVPVSRVSSPLSIPYSLTLRAIVMFLTSGGEQKDSPLVKSLSEDQERVW